MPDLVLIPNLTVILAHHDDESLFVGGLLSARREAGVQTKVITVCDVSVENPVDDVLKEKNRQLNRSMAYQKVCVQLGLGLNDRVCLNVRKNIQASSSAEEIEEAEKLIASQLARQYRPNTVVLTHPASGPVEHPQHSVVHRAVISAYPAKTPVLVYGDESAALQLPVNLQAKRQLLQSYRYGTTRTPEWDPFENPIYSPWCRDHEGYSWFGVDAWLKNGDRYGIKQIAAVLAYLEGRAGRLIDLGTGNGELLRQLIQTGWPAMSLAGQDIEPRHAALAELRSGVFIRVGDADDLSTVQGEFDFITAIGWLHNDWSFKYANQIPKLKRPRKNRYSKLAKSFWGKLVPGGEIIYTCRDEFLEWEKSLTKVGFGDILLLDEESGVRRAIKKG